MFLHAARLRTQQQGWPHARLVRGVSTGGTVFYRVGSLPYPVLLPKVPADRV